MGKLIAICISEHRGTQKHQEEKATLIENWGIEKDAHGGTWHRQVSLLSLEKIEEFQKKGAQIDFGAFGENLIIEGFDLRTIPVGTKIQIGTTLLELTQIGKECHSHCQIYKTMGDCIMPREGVFAKVITGGTIRPGDQVQLLPLPKDRPFTAAVITLSDKGSTGEREDKSGPLIKDLLQSQGYQVIESLLLPDGRPDLEKHLCRLADQRQVNLILTTGGTGFSQRDTTPEATLAVCDRMANGIAEAIHAKPRCIRNPPTNPDSQPPRKPQGRERKPGLYPSPSRPRTWHSERKRRRMRKQITEIPHIILSRHTSDNKKQRNKKPKTGKDHEKSKKTPNPNPSSSTDSRYDNRMQGKDRTPSRTGPPNPHPPSTEHLRPGNLRPPSSGIQPASRNPGLHRRQPQNRNDRPCAAIPERPSPHKNHIQRRQLRHPSNPDTRRLRMRYLLLSSPKTDEPAGRIRPHGTR